MKALLLCAGYGTRLYPITKNKPKCLVEIDGKPVLDFWLKKLIEMNIKDVLINTHFLPEKVEKYVKKVNYPLNINLVYEKKLLGTAGTLKANKHFFKKESIFLVHADNLSFFDSKKFLEKFKNRKKKIVITMMTFETEYPESCGVVELTKDGEIKNFYEKVKNPPTNLANGAVYLISSNIFKFLETLDQEYIDFSNDVIPFNLNKINTFKNEKFHIDIGTIENLKKARLKFKYDYKYLLSKN